MTRVVLSASVPELHRSRCQDAVDVRVLQLREGPHVSMTVADGVSSSLRGGDAARLAVAAVGRRAEELSALPSEPSAFLADCVLRAHAEVFSELLGAGICCLVTALVGPRESWIATVGDSSAYLFDGKHIEQLNPHDVTVRARRQNGENVVRDGLVVLDKGLTQAIGQQGGVEVHSVERTFGDDGGILCIATDGVLEAWLADFLRESGGEASQADVDSFCDRVRRESSDDASLALVRLEPTRDVTQIEEVLAGYVSLGGAERGALLARAAGHHLPSEVLLSALDGETDPERQRLIVDLVAIARPPLTMLQWGAIGVQALERGDRRLARLIRDEATRQALRVRR